MGNSHEIRAGCLRVGQLAGQHNDPVLRNIVDLERASDDRIVLQLENETESITLQNKEIVRVVFRGVPEIPKDRKEAAAASDMDAVTDLVAEAFEAGHDWSF